MKFFLVTTSGLRSGDLHMTDNNGTELYSAQSRDACFLVQYFLVVTFLPKSFDTHRRAWTDTQVINIHSVTGCGLFTSAQPETSSEAEARPLG